MDDQLLDAVDVADRLKVSLATVRAWTRLTDIPRIKLGRLTRFKFSDVLAWVESGKASLAQRATSPTRRTASARTRTDRKPPRAA
jgi:excisionase family DNA binding protein